MFTKMAGQLSPLDFTVHRVWEYVQDSESELPDETFMRPVMESPVSSLSGRLVGAQLTLANAQVVFGILGNIDLADPIRTEHFVTVTVFHPLGARFDLARYHDVDHAQRDSRALAAFLGIAVDSVFPIRYDIADVAVGNLDCQRGQILANPMTRLSQDELIELALE